MLIIFLLLKIIISNSQLQIYCGITIPADPLTAVGLSSPFIIADTIETFSASQYKSLNTHNYCNTLNYKSTVLIDALILDVDTGNILIYQPLVANDMNQVAFPTRFPILPTNFIIAYWFTSNGMPIVFLNTNSTNSINDGQCVFGDGVSIFGIFGYCNAINFFTSANSLIAANILKIPQVGNTIYKVPCLTTRHFGFVSEDQGTGVYSSYIVTKDNKVAQNTQYNRHILNVSNIIENTISNNRLLNKIIYPVIGCNAFTVVDLTEITPGSYGGFPSVQSSSLALNELFAMKDFALIPSGSPMVLQLDTMTNTQSYIDLQKFINYRGGLNQHFVNGLNYPQDTINYCKNMYSIAGPYLGIHGNELFIAQSPNKSFANNLLNFMAHRFVNSWSRLNCETLTNKICPITVIFDSNGVAIDSNILTKYSNNSGNDTTLPTTSTSTTILSTSQFNDDSYLKNLSIIFTVIGILLFFFISINLILILYIKK